MTIGIIIDIFAIIFSSIGLISSITILFLIFAYRSKYPLNTSMFLICNTYVSIIIVSCILLDMYGHSLYGDIYETISLNYPWCYIRSYLLHVGLCLLYHSFFLLACFRFFRIVLYKYKQLQSFRFIFGVTLILWLIDFLLMIPLLSQHWIGYISNYYFCEISITDLLAISYSGGIAYSFPLNSIISIYIYIIYYMKKTKSQSVLQNRHQINQRDLVVLRRIIILIGILIIPCFPTVIMWVISRFTNYIDSISYQIGWLSFTLSSSIVPIIFALLTSQLRQLLKICFCKKERRIRPIQIIPEC